MTLSELIGYKAMIGMITSPVGGIPDNVIDPAWLRPTRDVPADSGTFYLVNGTRKVAQLVHRGSPAVKVNPSSVSSQPFTCWSTFLQFDHQAEVLTDLATFDDPTRQDRGRQVMDMQTVEFRKRFNNARLALVYAVLCNGVVYFDGEGNMLPSSSGAVYTMNFYPDSSVTGNLTGTANVLLAGSAAKWSSDSTDIPQQIRDLLTLFIKTTGYEIDTAFYGENVLSYLLNNSYIQAMIQNNGTLQSALESSMIPQGFLGIPNWKPTGRMFFEDADGTIQSIADPDQITFTPAPSPEWWEVVEGTSPIPTNLGAVSSDAVSAAGNISLVKGMYSYAKVNDNPVGITHFAGDVFLPLQKVKKAAFRAKVHW